MALPSQIVDRSEVETYLGLTSTITDADRGLLQMIHPMVENLIRRHVGHGLTQATYVEYYPREPLPVVEGPEVWDLEGGKAVLYKESVAAGNKIILANPLVSAITEVREDITARFDQGASEFGAATVLTAGTQYYLVIDADSLSQGGELYRRNQSWPASPGTVKATYVAGLTAAQLDTTYSDIKFAVIEEIGLKFKSAKTRAGAGGEGLGVIQQKKVGPVFTSYETTSLAQVFSQGLSDPIQDKLVPYVRMAV